ncbi:MAG TPA: serine/threonine protein kinase [Planctomycetaceae bacterium]|nr:serine/threonine protein kinase [Planctomycetaceae bacterium]
MLKLARCAGRVSVLKGFVFICIVAAGTKTLAQQWPLFRGDPAGSGAVKEELPSDLDLLWEKRFDETEFQSGAAIYDGVIYIGDADGAVRALNLADGELIWEKKFDTFFITTPSVRDDTIYFGDTDGVLRALEAKTGKSKWEYTTGAEQETGPNFYKDRLLVTSYDGSLTALEADTGKEIWKHTIDEPIQCGPTLAGSLTFLGGCDESLHVIDVESGEPVQEPLPLFSPTGSTPSVSNGIVFVPTSSGEIVAYNPKEREPLWRFYDSRLASEFKRVSVAVAEGLVVATSRNKRVFALDAKTGKVRWQAPLRKRSDASPLIAGQSVFVVAADGRVLRFDLKTGKELWMMELKPTFTASPAAADGKLVVASKRGVVYCFGKR